MKMTYKLAGCRGLMDRVLGSEDRDRGFKSCGLYYNRAMSIATCVIPKSQNISLAETRNFVAQNVLAYSDYDHSYARSSVIVQATDLK